jgi:DNA-directed RNA polymerase subunit RPC12/RpoP
MRSTAPALDDDVYDLPSMPAATDAILTEWQHTASYTLDQPVRCPHCDERISVVHIVGLTRSQVAFTSTLPRKGRVIVCPECERILTAEL